MLIVSMLALISFVLVLIHRVVFALLPWPRRQADNCEVPFMMAIAFCCV
ncbi:hypothetical protein [Pseudomonas sp. DC3200b2]